jgi:hypothetical protein
MALDLYRARNLDQFAAHGPRGWIDDARNLHCDGRSTGDNMAVANPLRAGAEQRQRIYAGMPSEHPVFISDERVQVEQRDLVWRNRMAPNVIIAGKRPER